MTTQNPADKRADDTGKRGAGSSPGQPAETRPPSEAQSAKEGDPFGLASWMRWWNPAGAPAPAVPGLAISPQRLAELQDAYVKAMTAIWNDFVVHPDRAAAGLPPERRCAPREVRPAHNGPPRPPAG